MDFGTFSAQLCGLIGTICLAAFIVGGKQDNDGQGTNMTAKRDWE